MSLDSAKLRSRRGALLGLGVMAFACSSVLGIERYAARAEGVVTCDAAAAVTCAPLNGVPQTCVPAHTLGGQDFCADACDPTLAEPEPEHFECLGIGARVRTCDPNVADTCPTGLFCYRTEIALVSGFLYPAQPDGLCLDVPVCTHDVDCSAQTLRSECGSEVLRSTYPGLTVALALNNLHCVEPCEGTESTCGPGEACLETELFEELPPICVPTCDDTPCPPNFYCLSHSGAGYPKLCVPGIPGGRCQSPEDCMLGYCADSGAGFELCTIDCDSDTVCNVLDDINPHFMCLGGHCVTKAAYSGENCVDGTQCPTGKVCSSYNAYDPSVPRDAKTRECRLPCDENGHCEPRGGMPYVCLPNGECYPGDMGLGCASSDECMGALTCECVENCDDPAGSRKICTQACAHDEECIGYENALKLCLNGFCQLAPATTP